MLQAALIFAATSFFALAGAQSTNDTAVGIEAIEAHFKQAGLVPDLLTTFDPSALMTVNFDGVGDITPGQSLTEDQVKTTPSVSITPANSSVSLGSNFTLVMVDADVVGTDETQNQTRHWLVNGVSLSGSGSNETVDTSTGTGVTTYAGPAPASGSGAHRYVILLYTQPSSFTPPAGLDAPNVGVSKFSLSDYVKSTGLEGPVAGMYMTVEVGTATASISSTSAVVSSTLPVPSSAATGSGTSTGSAAGSTGTSGALSLKVGMSKNGLLALASFAVLALPFF